MNKQEIFNELIGKIIGGVFNLCLVIALTIYLIWFSHESICMRMITFVIVAINYHIYYFHESFKFFMRSKIK